MALTRPRAYQIYDIDYKQATRVVTVSNITLAGGAPNTVDSVSLAVNDRILVTGQSTASQNGIYVVATLGTGSNGTWTRSLDTNATGELLSGTIVMVTEGAVYQDTQWKLITDDPITIGVTGLTFVQNYSANSISSGTSNVTVLDNSSVLISSAGQANVVKVDAANITISANIIPSANVVYSLGTPTSRFKDLWISNNTIYLGNTTLESSNNSLFVNGAQVATVTAGDNLSLTGNLVASGNVTANGNVAGTYILGNGSFLTGIAASYGNANVAEYLASGADSSNIITTGNVTGNYFIGNGSLLTGITGGGGGTVYFQDTAPTSPNSGDIWIVGNTAVQLIYFSDGNSSQWAEMEAFETYGGSNVTNSPGGSIYQIQYNSGTGNFAGSSGLTFDGSTLAVAGAVSASGNVISSGNVYVSGLVGAGQLSVSGNVTVGGNITPVSNATQSLGNTTNFWKDLYLAGNSIYLGAATIAANATAVTITNPAGGTFAIQGASTALIASTVTATGNVVGGNITTAGQISAAGNITSAGNISGSYLLGNAYFVSGLSPTKIYNGTTEANIGTAGGNANISVGGVSNVAVFASTGLFVSGVVSASGNITGGNLSVGVGTATVGGIVNANANGVGNIGSQTTYFNTVFAQATSAQYADLAEFYEADAEYPPGTVLEFGGEREVTLATSGTTAVAGVVSTKPAYSMNAGCPGIPVSIALQGRVPCGVVGPVRKGDLMISAGNGLAKATKTPTFGQIIGKALENYSNTEPGVIEIAVGRL